jgi:hypothetical protein
MEQLPLLLNLLVGVLWLGVVVDLLKRPPRIPRGWGSTPRRAGWLLASLIALLAGGWGPPLLRSTTTAAPRDPNAGQPVESVSGMVRTPFAIVERTVSIDGEGRTIQNQRSTTLQLPLALLAFLGGAGWLQWRGRAARESGAESGGGSKAVVCMLLLGAALTSACGEGGPAAGRDRPGRRMVDVRWDTLAHVVSAVDDSLLFSAGRAAADADGFWIADGYGARVARFDWDGHLVRYVGRRGGGPGELADFRHIDVDDGGGLWVLDVPNNRISGFDIDGAPVDEIPLRGLTWRPDAFAVTGDGQSFLLMETLQELAPVILHRDGTSTRGSAIPVPDAKGAWGMALQGLATRERGGDRWVYAFASGDGFFRLVDENVTGSLAKYPEAVPFPNILRSVSREGSVTSTTTRLTNRKAAAASIAAQAGELYVVFEGETSENGRLLDRFDLETGRYLDTVLLPRRGYIAMWEDRLVVAGNNPHPEVLVLRRLD